MGGDGFIFFGGGKQVGFEQHAHTRLDEARHPAQWFEAGFDRLAHGVQVVFFTGYYGDNRVHEDL